MTEKSIVPQIEVISNDTLDQAIAELVDVARGLQERIGALEYKFGEVKAQLRELILQRGSNWADDEGFVRLSSDGIRTTYDTKALDELIINDPLRYGWLKDYRKQSPVRGSIQVK
ncbi:MAG: hypothetical protein BroJett018_45950 [Chloroflexota bacterium]|nr:MAG: hypothetical protein BroJett018_45950 [Chloroflexota bacterium]